MSGIRVNEWLHNSGTGGIWQTSAGNVGIASSVPTTKLEVTGDAKISGITTAMQFAPSQGQLANKNIIVNGDCIVNQRGISSTTSGYHSVDCWKTSFSGQDEALTQEQNALTSSDTGPWEEGFRCSLKVTNGNQTSGAGAADQVVIENRVEAQNMATSGWKYTDTTSYVTLSFWVKSSVAQTFYGVLETQDGTGQNYPFSTGALSANTWTKVVKSIPGNSNIQFDKNEANGLQVEFHPFMGTDFTDNSTALNTWAAAASGTRHPDMTSTWWTTNDSTFELTGVQLEVGSTNTPFEHLSYGDSLARCQRYHFSWKSPDGSTGMWRDGYSDGNIYIRSLPVSIPVTMRVDPTVVFRASMTHSNNESGGDTVSEAPYGNKKAGVGAKVRSNSTGRTYSWFATADAGGNHFWLNAEL